MNGDEFTARWFDGSLGKTNQCGSYYALEFDHAEFLCHMSRNTEYPNYPNVIALRCKRSGVIFVDNSNFKELPIRAKEAYKSDRNAVYTFDFRDIDKQCGDLSEIKLIDRLEVTSGTTRPVSLFLFDINGHRYYTEFIQNSFTKSREDFLNFRSCLLSATDVQQLAIVGTLPGCTDFREARLAVIPEEIKEFKLVDGNFLIPSKAKRLEVSPEVWAAAKWKPHPAGWGLPEEMLQSDGTFTYSWGVRVHGKDHAEKWLARIEETFPDEVLDRCRRWVTAFEKWKKASDIVNNINEAYKAIYHKFNLKALPDNAQCNENGQYFVKGRIKVPAYLRGEDDATIDLEDTWHLLARVRGI